MGFRNGAYAKVWDVQPGKGNFTRVRISISRKNKEIGQYDQEFSGYCMCIGHAHAKAAMLTKDSRIKLGDVDVTTTYDKAQKREYVNYKIFDFSLEGGGSVPRNQDAAEAAEAAAEDDGEGDLPF